MYGGVSMCDVVLIVRVLRIIPMSSFVGDYSLLRQSPQNHPYVQFCRGLFTIVPLFNGVIFPNLHNYCSNR